jgi:hypothetical protein
MTALTAIDVLIEPDARLVQPAKAMNARLHEAYAEGFRFDTTHAPHITLVHRYVETRELDRLFEAVERMVSVRRPIDVELVATGLSYVPIGEVGIMSVDVTRTPALDTLHDAVLELVASFARTGGTPTAFFTAAGEPQVVASIVQYVHDFVPRFSGASYRPHLTVGLGRAPFLDRMKVEPFAPIRFAINGIAVYQLGEYGSARRKLWGT